MSGLTVALDQSLRVRVNRCKGGEGGSLKLPGIVKHNLQNSHSFWCISSQKCLTSLTLINHWEQQKTYEIQSLQFCFIEIFYPRHKPKKWKKITIVLNWIWLLYTVIYFSQNSYFFPENQNDWLFDSFYSWLFYSVSVHFSLKVLFVFPHINRRVQE